MNERTQAIERNVRAYKRLKAAQAELAAAVEEYNLTWAAFEEADNLYGGKVRLTCGCIDICTNYRDHDPILERLLAPK